LQLKNGSIFWSKTIMALSTPRPPILQQPCHPQRVVQEVHPSVHSKTKRLIDVLGALVGLGLTAIVFFIPIAIAIYLDSPGPIFYSQLRCGYRGNPFRIWKFRSMVPHADQLKPWVKNEATGHIFKNPSDPRTTRVGRFLRRTSLDELPQFWNVLQGHMSLVGTRPPSLDEVLHYEPHHWQRLSIRPGITGEWQVRGRSEILDFEAIFKLDLQYQYHWSIQHDLVLILKTVKVVLTQQGAC
jgi:lipopolysaccharide/colanic/teichoic acid biosynthesis glycosyltransferase